MMMYTCNDVCVCLCVDIIYHERHVITDTLLNIHPPHLRENLGVRLSLYHAKPDTYLR